MWEPHTVVGNDGCFYSAISAHGTPASGLLRRRSQLFPPGAEAPVLLLQHLLVLREAGRAEGQR